MTLPMRRWLVDLSALAVIVGVTIVGWWPTFAGPAYLVAGLGALVLGLGIAALGARFGWGILSIAGATVGAFFLLGGPLALPHTTIAGIVPTLTTFRELAVGAVTSWKALLTTVAPVSFADGHGLVPFALTLVLTVTAGSLALRLAHAAWALIPLGVLLAMQILFGTYEPAQPLAQGLVLAVVVVVWLALRDAWAPAKNAIAMVGGDRDALRMPGSARTRVISSAVVLALAAGVGIGINAMFPRNEAREVIREYIVPPFDIHEYASPLQSYRLYVRDYKEQPLFTVAGGLPDDVRIRLGVMDTYNGIVYNVSDEGSGSTNAFTPLRAEMAEGRRGEPVELDITIQDYEGVWLPGAGWIDGIEFRGERAEELRRSTFYNPDTGTAVTQAGLAEGDSYTVRALQPHIPSDSQLSDVPFARVDMPQAQNVPEGLSGTAADAVADAETPIERVRALETFLSQNGFFSNGLEGEAYSLPGHGSRRIATLFEGEQMVGDDEQYAAAMAVMANEIGIPARVVMGFHDQIEPPEGEEAAVNAAGDFIANGDSLHAWVEVAFEGYGWVPFDPTPPEDQEPQEETTDPRPDPRPQVVQPPPPPQEPADLPPLIPDEREEQEENDPLSPIWGLILAIAGISLLVVILLMAPFVIIGLLKLRKRRKRLAAPVPADRISGGWEELMDRATDLGASTPVGNTRWEEAVLVGGIMQEPRMTRLAVSADASVFGPGEPTDAEIAAFWAEVDEVVDGMHRKASFWKRTKARLSLTSLMQGSGLAARMRAFRERVASLRKDG